MAYETTSRRNDGLGLFLAVVVCVLVPLWIADIPLTRSGLLAVFVLVVAGGRICRLLALGEPRMMELSTWSFVYVFFGLASLVQIQTNTYPSTAPIVYFEYLDVASLLIAIAVLSGLIGVMLAPLLFGKGRDGPSKAEFANSTILQSRVQALSLVALSLNFYYLLSVGFLTPLSPRADLRAAQVAAWPSETMSVAIVGLCTMPLLVCFIALVQLRSASGGSTSVVNSVLLFLTGAAILYSVNPVSSPRYYFGTVILAIVAVLGAYNTPRRVRIASVSFLVGLVMVFPLADAFRNSAVGIEQIAAGPMDSLVSGDFDGLIQTMNTIRFYELTEPTPGKQALAVVLFWVPRDVWEEKPRDSATEVAEFAGYDHLNMSSPLWAELYINGGWILTVIGMLAFGVIIRRTDDRITSTLLTGRQMVPFLVIIPFYLIILLRGALLQAMVYLSIFALTSFFITRKTSSRGVDNEDIVRQSA